MNTLIYLLTKKHLLTEEGDKKMICKGSFKCQLWGELAALCVAAALIFGSILYLFT